MRKSTFCAVLLGIAMALIWSLAFVRVLNSPGGIGIGLCFGAAFAVIGSVLFKRIDG
jgi:hypothetical protein